jgi:hypothetical protein
MLYYTIFVKGLNNGTGYIDVALSDDLLLRDYLQYLDVGIKPHRTYVLASPPKGGSKGAGATGVFTLDLTTVTAITVLKPG